MGIGKENFYMYSEIKEQPQILENMLGRYTVGGDVVLPEIEAVSELLGSIKRYYFWGLGSSYFAALYGCYLFEEILGLPAEHETADEVIGRKAVVEPGSAVVIISQSGESSDAIAAAKKARQANAFVIGICNREKSSLNDFLDVILVTPAHREKAVAATKTFTAQLLMLALLTAQLAKDKLQTNILGNDIAKLSSQANEIIGKESYFSELAREYKNKEQIIVLGKKFNYPIALEAAQKIKETTYIHAEGQAAEEFLHGPKAILDKKSLLIYFITAETREQDLRIIEDLKKTGAEIIAVGQNIQARADKYISIPSTIEALCPILNIIPIQLISFFIALEKGIDVNQPRNISKIVKK